MNYISGSRLRKSLHLMMGVPEYSVYVEHISSVHPEQTIIVRETF
ncbi:YbdD/YjiX family protein [Nitrosomonas eutropha]|nr:YbdD/YjiX family protein [Nitrosomonas eutropha]